MKPVRVAVSEFGFWDGVHLNQHDSDAAQFFELSSRNFDSGEDGIK
jgi:hypothetical protein